MKHSIIVAGISTLAIVGLSSPAFADTSTGGTIVQQNKDDHTVSQFALNSDGTCTEHISGSGDSYDCRWFYNGAGDISVIVSSPIAKYFFPGTNGVYDNAYGGKTIVNVTP